MASPPDTQAPPPGGTAMASPAHSAQPPAGLRETLGDLGAQWGKPSCPRLREGQDVWGEHGFICYLEAICEHTLDEVREWAMALVVRGDGGTVRSRGKTRGSFQRLQETLDWRGGG